MLNFLTIKFMALGLSSLRSLLLAAFLGPASYGVFGTLILIQQCLSYAALGMREGVAVSLVQSASTQSEVARICGSALTWGACVGAVVALGTAVLHAAGVLGPHLVWVATISFLSIVNEILININRHEDKLRKIALLELLYNAAPLGAVLYFWKAITISEALASIAAGLLSSVIIYLLTVPGLRGWRPSWPTTKRLLGIGLPLAVLSALILLVNSVYIILANHMQEGAAVGLVVFSVNICTIIMFALNAIAWATMSRSMRVLYGEENSHVERDRVERVRLSFRLGIVLAVIVSMGTGLVFPWVLKAYRGAEEFILYFCLFQAYGLLLFDEVNYLTVTSRFRLVIAGYSALLVMTLAPAYIFPSLAFATLVKLGIVFYFLLAIAATAYCTASGDTQGRTVKSKFTFLLFPVVCMLLYSMAGVAGAAIVCALFAPATLRAWHAARPQAGIDPRAT